jgi:hypothetical protein
LGNSLFPRGNREEAVLKFQLKMKLSGSDWGVNHRFGKPRKCSGDAKKEINGLANSEKLFPRVRKSHIY